MPKITYEKAQEVWDAICRCVNGDIINGDITDELFDWYFVEPDDYYALLDFICDAIESLKE